jgi:hypothetical protein
MGKLWASQPICICCWEERQPDREPVRLREPEDERCCWCGTPTRSGIYVRERLDVVPFPTRDK